MITTANLEKYRNGDFLQFVNNVLELLPQTTADQLNIGIQRTALQTAAESFNNAYMPIQGMILHRKFRLWMRRETTLLSGSR